MVWRFEIDIDSGTELEGWFGDMYGTGHIEWEFLIFFSVRVRSADGLREGEGGKGYITFR